MTRNFSPWEHFLAEMRDRPAGDPCPVDDPSALAVWRTRFASVFADLLGPLPDPVPLRAEVVETIESGSHVRHKVVYDSERHMSVPAWLLVPVGRATPGPAVLAQHGHGPGKDEICGLRGAVGAYGLQLVERGYVVLAPDLRTFGERADFVPPAKYGCDLTHTHLSMLGRNLLAADLWDVRCGIDYLAAHPLVDPARIGVAGLSQGGTIALFLAAWDARVAACVVSGYLSSWAVAAAIPWNMCGSQVLHGMLGRMEHVDVAALVAPRPLHIETGMEDPIFPMPVALHAHARLAKVYAAMGAPEALSLDVFEGGHEWHGTRAFPFLERWLGTRA